MSVSVTAIILTKNEEENIRDCIKSLSFCDEILIIDDYSTDQTLKIIDGLKNNKIRLIKHHLNEDFSYSRNLGLKEAKNEWILFVDADERVSDPLAFEISNAIYQSTDLRLGMKNGFYIKRKDFMWGKTLKYGESGIKILRLVKKNEGKWEGKVHEVLKVKGKVGSLNNYLIHFPHVQIADFLREINFYTDIRAEDLYSKKVKVYWWSIIIYSLGKFIVNFLFKRGFLDGLPGFVHALIMSFHSFLVRGKLYLLWNKE